MRRNSRRTGPSGGQTHRAPLLALAASCLLGLVGSFLPFLLFVRPDNPLFPSNAPVPISAWDNLFAGAAASLFVGLLIVAVYAWNGRSTNWVRKVGFLAISVGVLQLSTFAWVATLSNTGWTGRGHRLFVADANRPEIPDAPVDPGGPPPDPEDHETRAPAPQDTTFQEERRRYETAWLTDQLIPRPVSAIGACWMGICALMISACGVWILRRHEARR